MGHKHGNPDQELIQSLRAQAEHAEALERRIRELETERARWHDSTQRLSSELDELSRIRAEWEWFFEHSLEMLCIAGLDGYFKRVNPVFVSALGYDAEELLTRPFVEFVHPDDVAPTLEALKGLGANQDCINFENRYRHRDGTWRWICWHCPALTSATTKIYAIARDVTDRKRADFELLYRASHDPLTKLHNRAAFEEGLATAIQRIRRNPGSELALYVVDLDGFKGINDTYGHPAGDRILQELGGRLLRVHRDDELVCRLGGDEFAFLVESQRGVSPDALARRIVEAICEPIALDEATVSVGCCIGIAVFPRHAHDAGTLVSRADAALYSVKKTGVGGFRVSPETQLA